MKKRLQAMAMWCMTHQKELLIFVMVVLVAGDTIIYMARSVLTNTDIMVVSAVCFVSFLPALVGGLYEWYLSPDRWFPRIDDYGKL